MQLRWRLLPPVAAGAVVISDRLSQEGSVSKLRIGEDRKKAAQRSRPHRLQETWTAGTFLELRCSHVLEHKVMEEEALVTSGQSSKGRLRVEKRSRARNWDVVEMLSLAHAKRAEWERYEQATVRERAEMSAQQKWDAIGRYMQEHGFPERDGRGCKVKWENLLSDFKGVKDWENRSGNEGPEYWAMSSNERQAAGLPRQFAQELFDVLDNLYSTRQLPEEEFPESPTSTGLNTGLDNVGSGDREPGSSHQKRKGGFAIGVEKSIRETRDTCVAGIERERTSIGKERMEDDRADRRALIGVLATLASACDKIATKLN